MKIKTILNYHFSAIKLAKIQKFENTHCWQSCEERASLLHCW